MGALLRPATDYTLYYMLSTEEMGVTRLKLWELSDQATSATDVDHYLYKVNYTFPQRQEAEAFLQEFLILNGAIDMPADTAADRGQVMVLPFPTWN